MRPRLLPHPPNNMPERIDPPISYPFASRAGALAARGLTPGQVQRKLGAPRPQRGGGAYPTNRRKLSGGSGAPGGRLGGGGGPGGQTASYPASGV